MAWNSSKSVEEIRKEFFERWYAKSTSTKELFREYGISRKTAYKWINRQLAGESLADRSRRPKSSPKATSPEMEAAAIAIRKEHPTLGGAKISIMLKNDGHIDAPSGSTVTEILRRNNLLDQRAVAEAMHIIRFAKSQPNEMWQMDFKGHFMLDSGERCHPLNVIDDCSRFATVSMPVMHENLESVKLCLISAFREYGLPKSMLCDNGNPWGTSGDKGITTFEMWAMGFDILILHGRPLHPQTQGKEERFNKTWKREVLEKLGPRPSINDVISESNAFRTFYNEKRPHFGIGGKCPCELYRKSEREYPEVVSDWTYPEGWNVRRVNCKGYVWTNSTPVYVGEGLRGKEIAMCQSSTHPDCVNLIFRNFRIGRLNLRSKTTEYLRAYRLEGDPRSNNTGEIGND